MLYLEVLKPDRLKKRRIELKLKPVEVAERAGITRQQYNRLEKVPSDARTSTVRGLAEALETTSDYIQGLTDDPHKSQYTEEEIEKLGFRARATEGDLASLDNLERMHQALLREYEAAKRLREFEQRHYEDRSNPKSGK